MVDNAVVWLGKFCFAFSFTDTFYMGFSHLDTKIEDLFFLLQNIFCSLRISGRHHLNGFRKHFLD